MIYFQMVIRIQMSGVYTGVYGLLRGVERGVYTWPSAFWAGTAGACGNKSGRSRMGAVTNSWPPRYWLLKSLAGSNFLIFSVYFVYSASPTGSGKSTKRV